MVTVDLRLTPDFEIGGYTLKKGATDLDTFTPVSYWKSPLLEELSDSVPPRAWSTRWTRIGPFLPMQAKFLRHLIGGKSNVVSVMQDHWRDRPWRQHTT
ncbi:hypothetical protein SCLCIDRAFT_192612 [Scleroderma citrinum Foug A]|uniref:Uncharacterized protein n=1 Tax=Scleroderma citrinum Foug A TaxID=1036808 RepID=A0A0C3DLR3_9AGAM|nr:hypothetical protein SCLCIDRAFT_192612 [Scleroderma citrinum Foug A]